MHLPGPLPLPLPLTGTATATAHWGGSWHSYYFNRELYKTYYYSVHVTASGTVIRLSRTIKNVPREIRPMFWTCYNYNRLDYFNIYIDITVNDFICTLYLFYKCESKTDLTVLYRRSTTSKWHSFHWH